MEKLIYQANKRLNDTKSNGVNIFLGFDLFFLAILKFKTTIIKLFLSNKIR